MHQLRICVPVSASDVSLLEQWVNCFIAQGGAKGHPVDFFPTPTVHEATKDAARAVQNWCSEVRVHKMPRDFKGGWPEACNHQFLSTVEILAASRNQLPWLWCELDTVFRKPGFANELIEEYVLTGNHGFMGVILPTRKILKDPLGEPYEFKDKGDLYMAGVAVYPPNFTQLLEGFQMRNHSTSWDIALRNYMRRAWRKTDLISTRSGTCNYRVTTDGIHAADVPGKPKFTENEGLIPEGSLIHHGCKDKSFTEIILEGRGWKMQTIDQLLSSTPVKRQEAPEPAKIPVKINVQKDEDAPKAGSGGNLAAVFAAAKAAVKTPEPVKATEPKQEATKVKSPPEPKWEPSMAEITDPFVLPKAAGSKPTKAPLPDVSADDLKAAVQMEKHPRRLVYYAGQFNTTQQHIKQVAKSEGSGMKITGPGWVKMA